MKQIDVREGARRQHRTAALFAVIQCWLRELDGLVFDRPDLERLLGLERFKKTRVDWMRQDFKDFFPHQEVFWYTYKQSSFASLYVSRLGLKGFLPTGSMSDEERIAGIPDDGPRIGKFLIWPRPDAQKVLKAFEAAVPYFADKVNYDERLLTSYLELLSQGQISPHSLPSLQKTDAG